PRAPLERLVSAQRCSIVWNPPGVCNGPAGTLAREPESQAPYALLSKLGIVGDTSAQDPRCPQTRPVPRGPNSHLWQPATRKSTPSSSGVAASTPKPWTPSRQNRICSPESRLPFFSATTAAISRTGSFTPVDECTHVS